MKSYSSIRHFNWFISATRNTSNQSTKNTLSLWFDIFLHRNTCYLGLLDFVWKEQKGCFQTKKVGIPRPKTRRKLYSQYFTCIFNIYILFQHTDTHTYSQTRKHTYMYCTYIHTHTHERAHAHIILYSLTHTHIHTYIHTYISRHKHIHIRVHWLHQLNSQINKPTAH